MSELKPTEWKRRRARLDLGLVFLASCVGYILFMDSDSEVQQAAITVLIPSFVSLIGAYVFGAVWDDKNYMNAVSEINKGKVDDTFYNPTIY